MGLISIRPGKSEVQLVARARPTWVPPALRDVPGGLYPMYSAAYEVDEYRILSGWPVPVPELDIRIECMVTADGDVLSNREEPSALVTGADMRWIADVDYYDQITGLWAPIQSHVSPWETSPEFAPTLITDYEYRVGDERFIDMTALNFDSTTSDHMWSDLSLSMGGTYGYTVVMVVNPNSIYGNDDTITENALWGPQSTEGSWVMFTVRDQAVFMTTESQGAQKGVSIGNALDSSAPTFVALVVRRPQSTLYAASGPSRMLMKALVAGPTPEPLSTRFWLGNGPFSTAATMDMALLDLGIYGNPLTRAEVADEFALLSQVYGGDT